MEQHYKNFITTFFRFITDYDRYVPNEGCKKALAIYNNLDMAKVIFKVHTLLKTNNNKLSAKDETLFNDDFVLLPGVNLSENWMKLTKGQKDKLWTYLNILYLETDILMNQPNNTTTSTTPQNESSGSKKENDVEKQMVVSTSKQEFNPYLGIGGDTSSSTEYGVNDMFANLPEDDGPSAPGLSTIASMIGLDKMVNMDDLQNQLQNMKPEDIESATENIKGMLGDNIDEKTSQALTDMLNSIANELSNNKMNNGGNPLDNIINIAKKVSGKMQSDVENNNIDISKLFQSTQALASQCKDKDGKPMFDEKNNPFNLIEQMTKNMKASNGNINEEACMKQCNDMLKNMGMDNIDLNNPDINQIMAQMQRNNPNMRRQGNLPRNKQGGKRKKNNK